MQKSNLAFSLLKFKIQIEIQHQDLHTFFVYIYIYIYIYMYLHCIQLFMDLMVQSLQMTTPFYIYYKKGKSMQILVLYFNIGCRVKSRWYANYLFQCHISHIKTAVLYYLIYSCSRLCFTKTKSPFFLPQYAAPLLDNLIKVLSPRLRAKSTMNESLDFS